MTGERRLVGRVLAVLTTSNVVANRLLPDRGYIPWNLAVAGVLLRSVRRGGHDRAALRLDPADLPRGILVGLGGAAAVSAVGAAMSANARTATAFTDDRAAAATVPELLHATLVRIPFGTALLEELAFRAVLPVLVPERWRGTPAEALLPAAAFGLWHVLPSRGLGEANAAVGQLAGRGGDTRVRLLAVAATTAGGLVLEGVARAGRHVIAPTIVHAAVNSVTYALAWRQRNGRPRRRGWDGVSRAAAGGRTPRRRSGGT